MKIKTLIACLGAFITLISGVGFNTLNNQKEVNQNENIIIADVVDSENNNDLNENLVIDLEERSNEIVETEEQNIEETQETTIITEDAQVNEIKNDLKELQEKFKVASLEDAKNLYAKQEKELNDKLKEIDEKLEIYENSINIDE